MEDPVLNPWSAQITLLGAWAISWVAASIWSSPAARRASLAQQAPNLLISGAGGALLFLHARTGPAPFWQLHPGGAWLVVAVSASGLAFAWWARLHLGALWSGTVTRKDDHRLIDTGPYRLVRHPIYTGILMAALGQAVLVARPAGWLGLALLTFGFVIKARLEERFLREGLAPEQYDAYAARTPMLAPWPRRAQRR